jgi:hypothetical protein
MMCCRVVGRTICRENAKDRKTEMSEDSFHGTQLESVKQAAEADGISQANDVV